jgi:hypothetical protein
MVNRSFLAQLARRLIHATISVAFTTEMCLRCYEFTIVIVDLYSYLSYGLCPHKWAAEFTSHVRLSVMA